MKTKKNGAPRRQLRNVYQAETTIRTAIARSQRIKESGTPAVIHSSGLMIQTRDSQLRTAITIMGIPNK